MNEIQALSKIVDELEHRIAELEKRIDKIEGVGQYTEEELHEFNGARILYRGSKRGAKTEMDNFIKKHKDWRDIMPTLAGIITAQNEYKDWLKTNEKFCPEWKHFQTWINNRWWEAEIPTTKKADRPRCQSCGRIQTNDRKKDKLCIECEFKENQNETTT